jgi:hypothetical protein
MTIKTDKFKDLFYFDPRSATKDFNRAVHGSLVEFIEKPKKAGKQ